MTLKPWSCPKSLSEPTPADWGIGMTVCIASYNFGANCMFFASDTMISTGEMSADLAAFKFRSIARNWMALYAGNDISLVTPIIRQVQDRLRLLPDTLENVQSAFIEAFHYQLEKKAENEVLRPLGFNLTEFKQEGLLRLGGDNFSRLLIEIQQQNVDVQFLIGGFDNREPFIFTVSSPGKISDYTEIGLWAIGSGQTNALGSIFNATQQMRYLPMNHHLYRILEAKFNAETAVGVGKHTSVSVLFSDTSRYTIFVKQDNELRKIWEKTRVTVVPPEANGVAEKLLIDGKADGKKRERARKRKLKAQEKKLLTQGEG